MSEKFVILHLSDAHLGHPKHADDSLNVFEPLFDDLKIFYRTEKLKPSIVIFSGDLAFGDLPKKKIEEQYAEAKGFLEKICSCFETPYGEIPILIVPGNHDIDRNLISDGEKLLRNTFTEEIVSDLMYRNDITWKRILERQKEWFAFVNTIPKHPWKWNADLHMATGIIQHHGTRVGIAGLNSSWASHEEKETGALWVGKRQYDTAYNVIRDADFKIIVFHHPVDWLHPEDKKSIGQKIETQFQIYLHGHEHEQWFTASDGHLKCLAGACYNGSKERNGFSWLVVDTDTSEVTIHLREYTNEGKGGWRANHIPDKTDKEGVSHISLVKKHVQAEKAAAVVQQKPQLPVPIATKFPDNLETFIRILIV